MKIQLHLNHTFSSQGMDNKIIILRAIQAVHNIEVPTEYVPSHIKIGNLKFLNDQNFYDVDHQCWVSNVVSYENIDIDNADPFVESLRESGWEITQDEKNMKMMHIPMTRDDAIALIEIAKDGLKARGKRAPTLLWTNIWSESSIKNALYTICHMAIDREN